jgi:phenylacetate-CoA ligase
MKGLDLTGWLDFWRRPRFGPDRIRAYQDARVRRLVEHAWHRIPYYHRLMEAAGLRPADIRTRADLARFPVTRRRDLQGVPLDDLVDPGVDPEKCISFSTSGTTGEPVRMLRTRREQYLLFGFRLRAQILSGLRPIDRRVKLGSTPVRLLPHRIGLFRMSNIDLNLGPEETLQRLKALRPHVIYGIPNMLEMLVKTAPPGGLESLRPKLVFSGAEPLRPSLRRELERLFGCPVIDFYGCHEFNLIAWQCARCGLYHTSDDSTVVEVLKADGQAAAPGEQGEIFGTALRSYAMPFIRLEIGDVVTRPARRPECEIGFDVIGKIRGRTADFLPLPGGRILSPYHLSLAVDSVPGVRRYQIIQTALDHVRILYVRMEGASEETGASIAAKCRECLPPEVVIETRTVADIPITAAGKHRLVQAFHPS